jgi:hypothetical protein
VVAMPRGGGGGRLGPATARAARLSTRGDLLRSVRVPCECRGSSPLLRVGTALCGDESCYAAVR